MLWGHPGVHGDVLHRGGELDVVETIEVGSDTALPERGREVIEAVLTRYRREGIHFHALRTRDAGARRFVSVHVLVPGAWTVQAGHDLLERLEADLDTALGGAAVFTHLEPVEDPASWADGRDHPEGPVSAPTLPGD